MLKEKIAMFLEQIRSIEGISSCAIVSRDGIIAGKFFSRELDEPWFGALAATILASAESAGGIVKIPSLESVTLRSRDTSIMLAGAGDHFLIAAILDPPGEFEEVHSRMLAVAQQMAQVM